MKMKLTLVSVWSRGKRQARFAYLPVNAITDKVYISEINWAKLKSDLAIKSGEVFAIGV